MHNFIQVSAGYPKLHTQGRASKQWRSTYTWVDSSHGTFGKDVVDAIRTTVLEAVADVAERPTSLLLFLGIFCRRDDIAARMLMRQTSFQLLVPPVVTAKFVLCHPRNSESDPMLWAELQDYDDLYFIDCAENMNDGKSLTYLTSVRRDFPAYAYYGKMDTDSYVLFPNLAFALAAAPRCRLYAGRSNYPMFHPTIRYMSGSLYILSADLVRYFELCGPPCVDVDGIEDMQIGEFVQSFVQDDFSFADLGSASSILYHLDDKSNKLGSGTVYVHDLKTHDKWWEMHRRAIEVVAVQSLDQARNHSYFEGPHTRWWEGNCDS